MPKAPLARPDAAPAAVEAIGPGIVFNAKFIANNNTAMRTKMLKANCIGGAGMLARAQTPIGVAIKHPSESGNNDRQCTSFQMLGKRLRLATSSIMKIEGTIWAGV